MRSEARKSFMHLGIYLWPYTANLHNIELQVVRSHRYYQQFQAHHQAEGYDPCLHSFIACTMLSIV